MDTSDAAPLYLRKREDRRLRQGHLWVYSNEVDTGRSPLRSLVPGQAVRVVGADERFVGWGYANPATLICARLLSTHEDEPVNEDLLGRRIAAAQALRARLYPQPCYRLVFGEADLLPGLVVDRYGDWLVGQINTAGMEALRAPLERALAAVTGAAGLWWRNETDARTTEGLAGDSICAWGEADEGLTLEENGLRFGFEPGAGQKTGWFYDQRENRAWLSRWVQRRRAAGEPPHVLDVCSYTGGFGVTAAAFGAGEVLCVDSSASALEGARANAALNGTGVQTRRADAFDALNALAREGRRFDVVVLDPPAFIKRRRDAAAGRRAYQRLNELALGVLRDDGLLVSCSCSFHFAEQELIDVVQAAAVRRQRPLQLLHAGGQAPDHPVHPAIAQTRYLSTLFLRALPVPGAA